MTTHSFTYTGPDGSPVLGSLNLPVDGRLRATALLADAFSPVAVDEIVRGLTGIGVGVVRAADPTHAAAAARELARTHEPPAVLVGHAAGGEAVLQVAFDMPSVRAVVVVGTSVSTGTASRMGGLKRPLLVMHAPTDRRVAVTEALRVLDPAKHPKSFVALGEADHEISDPGEARFAADMIRTWVDRYVPALERAGDHAHHASARIGRDRFRTEIRAGGHRLLADEPFSLEGTDRGPTPFELLLAGLGGCTAITIRMYADRKGWPLEAVHVDLVHERVAPEEAGCEAKGPGMVDRISTRVRLEGTLDEAQQARLMDISEKCPVHKALKISPCMTNEAG